MAYLIASFVATVLFLLQVVTPGIFDQLWPILLGVATPFVVKYATDFVLKFLPNLQGWHIVAIVVPVIAGVATGLTQLITQVGPTWYWQLALGLLAVFVNEVLKQLKQAPTT